MARTYNPRKPKALYPQDELLCRPIEHVVEALSCSTLERLSDRGHAWWHEVKRGRYGVPSETASRLYDALDDLPADYFQVVDRLHNPQVNQRKTYRLVPRPVPPKSRRR